MSDDDSYGSTSNEFDDLNVLKYGWEENTPPSKFTGPICWLPHACDEWVIGGVREAEALMRDLAKFIEFAKSS